MKGVAFTSGTAILAGVGLLAGILLFLLIQVYSGSMVEIAAGDVGKVRWLDFSFNNLHDQSGVIFERVLPEATIYTLENASYATDRSEAIGETVSSEMEKIFESADVYGNVTYFDSYMGVSTGFNEGMDESIREYLKGYLDVEEVSHLEEVGDGTHFDVLFWLNMKAETLRGLIIANRTEMIHIYRKKNWDLKKLFEAASEKQEDIEKDVWNSECVNTYSLWIDQGVTTGERDWFVTDYDDPEDDTDQPRPAFTSRDLRLQLLCPLNVEVKEMDGQSDVFDGYEYWYDPDESCPVVINFKARNTGAQKMKFRTFLTGTEEGEKPDWKDMKKRGGLYSYDWPPVDGERTVEISAWRMVGGEEEEKVESFDIIVHGYKPCEGKGTCSRCKSDLCGNYDGLCAKNSQGDLVCDVDDVVRTGGVCYTSCNYEDNFNGKQCDSDVDGSYVPDGLCMYESDSNMVCSVSGCQDVHYYNSCEYCSEGSVCGSVDSYGNMPAGYSCEGGVCNAPDEPPEVSVGVSPEGERNVGDTVSVTVSATDDNQIISISLSVNDETAQTVTCDEDTCSNTWDVELGESKTWTFRGTAKDDQGQSGTDTMTVSVTDATTACEEGYRCTEWDTSVETYTACTDYCDGEGMSYNAGKAQDCSSDWEGSDVCCQCSPGVEITGYRPSGPDEPVYGDEVFLTFDYHAFTGVTCKTEFEGTYTGFSQSYDSNSGTQELSTGVIENEGTFTFSVVCEDDYNTGSDSKEIRIYS